MPPTPRKRPPIRNTGDEIIRGLTGLRDALATGERLADRFTMRTVELDLDPRPWTPAQVRALRTRLKASQPVFAKLVGANVKTIQAWEQGKPPPPMARRLLDCIAKDLAPWEKILREAAVTKAR
jgi:putative transcriptional regulator